MDRRDTDSIRRTVEIAAPVERVWELVTVAEHLGRWFADAGAEVELRPGGAFSLSWAGGTTCHGRVEAVDRPRLVAYRWLAASGSRAQPTPANSTVMQFALVPVGDRTRLTVVESGFDALDVSLDERARLRAEHVSGWVRELDELDELVRDGELTA